MHLSLQLFTVRDAMAADRDGTLAAIREMGIGYVELAGFYGLAAKEFAAELERHNLKVSGSHVSLESLENELEQVVADCKSVGCEWVIVPWVPEQRRDWVRLGHTLSGFGERLSAEGLRLAYHNHDFELREDQGLRQLIAETHPMLVSFQIDVGWVRYVGMDPAKLLWELGPRVPLVHLKDMDPGCDQPHVVAGDGAVHWDEVLAACEGIGVQFGAIEMDIPPHDPIGDVRACAEYFRARGVG